MTIERGKDWGTAVTVPADIVLVRSDADAVGILRAARSTNTAVPPIGLTGGDLARTLGGGAARRFEPDPTTGDAPTVVRATVDLLRIDADGRSTLAAAHVVFRRRWWSGTVVFVVNAQYLGGLDVAPRSHPNDGLADLLEVAPGMDVRTRLQARRRARTGTHVPHPLLSTRRGASFDLQFGQALDVWVDGERWGSTTACHIAVEPDALVVHA